jgi:hypothetical protein
LHPSDAFQCQVCPITPARMGPSTYLGLGSCTAACPERKRHLRTEGRTAADGRTAPRRSVDCLPVQVATEVGAAVEDRFIAIGSSALKFHRLVSLCTSPEGSCSPQQLLMRARLLAFGNRSWNKCECESALQPSQTKVYITQPRNSRMVARMAL